MNATVRVIRNTKLKPCSVCPATPLTVVECTPVNEFGEKQPSIYVCRPCAADSIEAKVRSL